MGQVNVYKLFDKVYVEFGELPYEQAVQFSSDLKMAVPWRYRKWDEDSRRWVVRDVYQEKVEELAEAYFGQVVNEIKDKTADLYATFYLLSDAPYWLVAVVHEMLSREAEGEPDENVTRKKLDLALRAIEKHEDEQNKLQEATS